MEETQSGGPAPIDQLADALAQFQAEVPTVAKTKTAQIRSDKGNYSYTYADLADVTETAMPILSKHGLAFITIPGNGVLTGMLLHSSGQSITGSLPITGGTPQQIGSSLTYMRRYLLGCMTGLVTDNDDDGQLAQAASSRSAAPPGPPAATRTMSRKPRATKPEPESAPVDPNAITAGQLTKLAILLGEAGMPDRPSRLAYVMDTLDREVASSKDLTKAEAHKVIERLTSEAESPFPEPPPEEGS